MRAVVGGRWSVISLWAFLGVAFLTSCSIPNLESEECTPSRDAVRELYSYHFGHDLGFTDKDLEARREYLTPNFFESLRQAPQVTDPFTHMENPPKAFRIGECKVLQPGSRTSFEVLLFWKDDAVSEQRAIHVETQKEGSTWLVDRVSR
ncbi:MAG TPA: hypothetical protein VJV05_02415 [Pyrinomonadaceae bacterium]|nr:hypothetical protein [Pyrinomonadaceae bacterium]